MELAVDLTTTGQTHDAGSVGCVYVIRIGIDLYKVGKAKNYEERMKAHRTMSAERFALYALIETEHYSKLETYLKHLLQGHRWDRG